MLYAKKSRRGIEMPNHNLRESPITICELEGGERVRYDACSSKGESAYDEWPFKYIGKGKIYSVDGVKQSGEGTFWFFVSIRERG